MAQPFKTRLIHEVPAGNQLTGELPDGVLRRNRNREYTDHWTTLTKAGLMDPVPDRDFPIIVKRIALVLDGNTSAWSIVIDDEDVSINDPLLLSGTNEVNIVNTDPQYLVPGQNLKVVTVGASGQITAEILWDRAPLT